MATVLRDRRPSADKSIPRIENNPADGGKRLLTAQEYLAIERKAEFKSEFHRGEMIAMPGASLEHNQINRNLSFQLITLLLGHDFEVLYCDMRVRIPAIDLYTYPDILVCKGEPIVEERELDVLLNPHTVVEILSKSTQRYDRVAKFEHYSRVETLEEYLLLSQARMKAETRVRQPDGTWTTSVFEGSDAVLDLPSLSVKIPLAKIYEKVKFEASP